MSNELVWMSEASKAIAKAGTIGETKAIGDRAAAIKIFAKKQNWSIEQRGEISAIEIRATARMGELLKEMKPQAGAMGVGKKVKYSKGTSLLDTGVTKKQSSTAQKIASLPKKVVEKYITENKAKDKLSVTGLARIAKEATREAKREKDRKCVEVAAKPEQINGVFSTIVIDPPWDFGDEGDVDQFGRGKPDFATMSIDQIASLPVAERAAADAHIYLWITNRSLPKGFALLESWGFRYVTMLTWCKPSFGMGNYFRGSTEQILFGVRGSLPLKRKDVGTWFEMPRPEKKHSAKPPQFYELVESCSHGPYLEMFARSNREGWIHWGSNNV